MTPQGSMSSCDLPYDIVINILLRLPVKTLIRFRCVCKSWYATITHPTFITTHLNRVCCDNVGNLQSINLASPGIRLLPDPVTPNCLSSGFISVGKRPDRVTPNRWSSGFISVGKCHGLVCLSGLFDLGRIVYLWNPSIRKFKTLTCPSFDPHLFNHNLSILLGFGFHHRTNDYKVIRILYLIDFNWKYLRSPPQVEVYSLNTNSWRKIEAIVPCFADDQHSNAFINGSVHWVASNRLVADRHINTIMSFDMGDEVFQEMMLPDYNIDGAGNKYLSLVVLKELLSLCVCFPYEDNQWRECFYIWVMKEYGVVESWTRQFTIVVPRGRVVRSFGFTMNNELLMGMWWGELVSYDPQSQELKFLGIRESEFTINIVPFMETLVLLEGRVALLGQKNLFDGVISEGICSGTRPKSCNHK